MNSYLLNKVKEQGVVDIIMNNIYAIEHREKMKDTFGCIELYRWEPEYFCPYADLSESEYEDDEEMFMQQHDDYVRTIREDLDMFYGGATDHYLEHVYYGL